MAFVFASQNITIVPDNVEDISMQLANATNLFDNSGTNTSLVLTAEIINNIANINSSSPRVTTTLLDSFFRGRV